MTFSTYCVHPEHEPMVIPCCDAEAYRPGGCTCWEFEYDLEQMVPPRQTEPVTRTEMCVDCAYKPKSPERHSEVDAAYDEDDLETLALSDHTFWCHQGMRLVTAEVHPDGRRIEQPSDLKLAYDPLLINGVPYKADGTPADRCAGQAARRRALAKQYPTDERTA